MPQVWPADATGLQPASTARTAEVSPLLGGATPSRPFGTVSGIRFGVGDPVAITSTTWTVQRHSGVIDGAGSNSDGPYGYAVGVGGETLPSGTIAAAEFSPRYDIVWARLDDPVQSDGTPTPTVTFGYTKGTALPSPVVPTPPVISSVNRYLILGIISMPGVGNGAPTWTTTAQQLATPIWPTRNVNELNDLPQADGMYADRSDLDELWRFNGTAWVRVGGPTVSVRLRAPGAQQLNSGTWTGLAWALDYALGPSGAFTVVNGQVTVNVGGLYRLTINASATTVAGTPALGVQLVNAGTRVYLSDYGPNQFMQCSASTEVLLSAGATVKAQAFCFNASGSGSQLSLGQDTTAGVVNGWSITKVG